HLAGARDRREIAPDVVGEIEEDRRVERQRARSDREQRVAISRRAGDRLHADRAIGAGPVLHDDRLRPGFAELLRQRAGDDVARAAGLVGRDDRHTVPGEGLRQRGGGGEEKSKKYERANAYHDNTLSCVQNRSPDEGGPALVRGPRNPGVTLTRIRLRFIRAT